jgi:sugar lactone lactonase YvrE
VFRILTCVIVVATAYAEPLTSGPLEKVADGFVFTEGPVWMLNGELLFTDIPKDTIFRADKTAFRNPSGKANGLIVDLEGRLVACEHWNRRVSRTEKDGTIKTLAEIYDGKKFNSPNDACVRNDGTIFFTDPEYGLEGRTKEQPCAGVYALKPDGTVKLLVSDFKGPNGIDLSPDQKTLYVNDSSASEVRAFDVADDATLSNGRVIARIASPDGMAVDEKGNIWTTGEGAVYVLSPKGDAIHVIKVPKTPANCAFGDADLKTLYITARDTVYKQRCTVAGQKPGAGK